MERSAYLPRRLARRRRARAALATGERPGVAAFVGVPLLYWLSAWLGSLFTLTPESVSLLWPPNAVLLAALVRYQGRGWPLLAALALVAEVAADLPHGISVPAALVFGLTNVLEVSVAFLLLRRWGFDPRFEHLDDVGRFLLAAPILGALLGATVGTTFLGVVEGLESPFLEAVFLWWFGDGLGLLVFFPLVMGLWLPARPAPHLVVPPRAVDLLIGALGLVVVVVVLFAEGRAIYGVHSRPVLILPFTVYAAIRLPFRWVCAVVATIALAFVWRSAQGASPYGPGDPATTAAWAQEFVLVQSLLALGIGSLLGNLRRHEEIIRLNNLELRSRATALEQSNAELRRVAFVAAHDLQTPLRAISGFAQLLRAEFEGRLGPVADDWIRRITEGTRRLEALLRDLSSLAAVDADTTPFERVDLKVIYDDVLYALDGAIREAAAHVSRGELPVVRGNPDQLSGLLKELVSNALKFRGEAPLRVHVSARPAPGEWVVSVRDNARGIPQEAHADVFELFYRLPDARGLPGTGFGLAMCARVVHRHGGRIWVEGEPGLGSTFSFTLPREEEAA